MDTADACIPWHGYVNAAGYGVFRRHGRDTKAHRHVYEECIGPIPDGLDVHHTCESKACVNPGHMELLSRREHMRRHGGPPFALGVIAAAAKRRARTHCKNGHEYTPENMYRAPAGHRMCRECLRMYAQRR